MKYIVKRSRSIFFRAKYSLSGFNNNRYVIEYPRSGGSWVANLLAVSLNAKRLGGLYINTKEGLEKDKERSAHSESGLGIGHGHYIYKHFAKMPLIMLRDGRDVMLSNYFHCFFNNGFNGFRVEKWKEAFPDNDVNNVRENLPGFIERMLNNPVQPRFTYQKFVEYWLKQRNVIYTKYETFLKSPETELERIISAWGMSVDLNAVTKAVEEFRIDKAKSIDKAASDRRDRHVRKGIVGDWRNYYNRESLEVFNKYAGWTLTELGYEKGQWIKDIK